MIISHKHKFIFIKTVKTAGTSVEIALSKHCGPDDIITPISKDDEAKRQELGYRGAQNYRIPFSKYKKIDWLKFAYDRERRKFYNHIGASEVMQYIEPDIWDSYYKFSFERNPWDKVVSWYYWRYKSEPRPSISEFVHSSEANIIRGFELYTHLSEMAVDQVFFFENINEEMDKIREKLNLSEPLSLPFAKGGHRKDKRSYSDILSDQDKAKIAKVYAREIAHFNYTV
ncbi:sulfotransferase family 2 domain-containing protein [Alteromonas halophila]|uniref:Sulfotransferase family protein n=1 Tax=Alteromonas halophila TaxID=516698 RepID=A0A918MYL7_9ALTE|nr:sulfotransferase family 2 domain-containing protein [Alteromonas halophila]GGW86576.1 hypothetical protein GCM10007391_20350 [Alteromonas halophila]